MDRIHVKADVELIAGGCAGSDRIEGYIEVDVNLAYAWLSSAGKILFNLAIITTAVSTDCVSIITYLSASNQTITTN
jgi:hypothetical protein